MSIFSEGSAAGGQSAEAELAALMKAEPEATTPPADTPEPIKPDNTPERVEPDPTETKADAPEPEEKPRGIPPAAVAEERERRRAAEARAQETESQLAQLRGQMEAMQRMFQQGQQPQAQQQEAPPDPEADPIAALKWERQQREQVQQQLQAFAIRERVKSDFLADAQRMTQANPDFPAAYQHLLHSRAQQLKLQGMPDAAVKQQMHAEEFNLVLSAFQQGISPAERAYELAKSYGYQTQAQKPAAEQAKAPVDPAMAEARKRAATGISEGGTPPKNEMSLEHIVNNLHGAAQDAALKKWEERNVKRASIFRS